MLLALLEVAYNVILPIFLILGVSVYFDRRYAPDPRVLSRLIVYLFAPALVLNSMLNNTLEPAEFGQIAALVVLFSAISALIGWGVARFFKFDRKLESGFILAVLTTNSLNYGLPLNVFAFGPTYGEAPVEQRALIYYAVGAFVAYTFGVFIASRGSVSTRAALGNVLKVPLMYAAVIGLAFNFAGWALPTPLTRSLEVLGAASVPAMLVVLGIQLSRASVRGRLKPIGLAVGIKLGLAPLVALALAALLGLSGLTRDVSIVESSMPTAVLAGVLATEFGSDAEFVTATIFVGTIASILSLSLLLTLLGAGV